MKIYTRSGDQGQTDLLGGDRVEKDSQRMHVCGTLDELNSILGLVRVEELPEPLDKLIYRIQQELFSSFFPSWSQWNWTLMRPYSSV